MVVQFANLPSILQRGIAVKMDISDSLQFQQSSKCGRNIGELVQKHLTMEIQTFEVQTTEVLIIKKDFDFFDDSNEKLSWRKLRTYKSCPRFCAKTIFNLTAYNELWLQILREVELGHFSAKDSNFHSIVPRLSLDPVMFDRILEAFNVTSFTGTSLLDSDLVRLPAFRRLKKVGIYKAMLEVEDLVALEASEIEAVVKPEAFSVVLNQFFTQFHNNQRDITSLTLNSHDPVLTRHVGPDEMFNGIPTTSWSIIWSRATHANSPLARVPIDDVEIGMMNTCCALENESNVLFVIIESNRVKVKKVRDPVEKFENLISDRLYYLATGFCRGCEKFNCSC